MIARPKLPANPPFCAGPFSRFKDSRWINGVDAFGGACHMLDMRGWGYLTGQGQALALPADEAIDAQNATAQWVVDALNAAWERDQGLITPAQRTALQAAIDAARKVKPLDWSDAEYPNECWNAGDYDIWSEHGGFQVYHWAIKKTGDLHHDLKAAQDAAFTHHETRVQSFIAQIGAKP